MSSEKVISFEFVDKFSENFIDPPKPSVKFMPEWYKKTSPIIEGHSRPGIYGSESTTATSTTYKSCSPFMDSFFMGYIWASPVDIEIKKIQVDDSINYSIRWRTEGNFVSSHGEQQHPNLPKPASARGSVLKWEFPFTITTPEGYSCIFTHPFNRNDLPFLTLDGVVDTDSYDNPIKFPFHIMEFDGDSIVIEKGTPLCQIIPFKREAWSHRINPSDENSQQKRVFVFLSKIIRSYKSRHWHRKEYR